MVYTVKYRQPGQWFWHKVKRVKNDGILDNCRWFHLENDTLIYISTSAEVIFSRERQAVIEKEMSAEIGQPVVRAV